MERRVRLEDLVDRRERARRTAPTSRNAPSLVACMCAKSSTGRTQPVAPRDLDDVVERAEVAHAAHHLDAERHGAVLRLEALAQRPELLDDRVDRVLAAPLEQEARVEDDELGAARGRDARASVERADRRRELPPARLEVAHEAEERRVHRERDVVLARELAEPLRERVVHPEAALEVDLAGRVPALEEELDRLLGRLARRHPRRPDADRETTRARS